MLKPSYKIPSLPPAVNLDTVVILKALACSTRALAELKGRASSIPNPGILIDTLSLQEAKASSEIENIVTTHDELFQADLFPEGASSPAAKEVALYRAALRSGYQGLIDTDGLLPNNVLVEMFQLLKNRDDGFRSTQGTVLRHDRTGQTVYVPPQSEAEIIGHMRDLEHFINEGEASDLDPLIKMALIHHQFESIHPFPDGNGRIGRILNVLYLTQSGLLDIPILYLSRYITENKAEYYRLLQAVRDEGVWEEWILYILKAVEETAITTLHLVNSIREQMATMKHRMRTEVPKLYSQDMLNNLLRHPYTRIEFVVNDLGVTRQTASRHLDALAGAGFVTKHQSGRSNYYVNEPLVRLFLDTADGTSLPEQP